MALGPERLDRRVPLVVRPDATSLQDLACDLAGRGVGDERFAAVDPLGGHRRDVDVAAELAQEGLRVPQHEEGIVGPRKRRVSREQRLAREMRARGLGGAAGQAGGLLHVR